MLKELPENIAVKFTLENRDIINSWGRNRWKHKWGNMNSGNYMVWDGKDYCTSYDSLEGFIEITFEDFKRLVLKEKTELKLLLW